MTLRKPARSAITEILNKRSDKTHPRDLTNISSAMIKAANETQLQVDGNTKTLLELIQEYHVRTGKITGLTPKWHEMNQNHSILISVRNGLADTIIMDTNPLINGTWNIKSYKNQLISILQRQPLNSGANDERKEAIARDWTDRITDAMIASLTPELQAGLSQNSGIKR